MRSVICTDKTGTLTKGEMTAVRMWRSKALYKITGNGYEPVGTFEELSASPLVTEVRR